MVGVWFQQPGTHFLVADQQTPWSVRKPIAWGLMYVGRSYVFDGLYGLLDRQFACDVVAHGGTGMGV